MTRGPYPTMPPPTSQTRRPDPDARKGTGGQKGDIQNAVHLSRKSAPRLHLLDLRKT
jgi:hypothetical protein